MRCMDDDIVMRRIEYRLAQIQYLLAMILILVAIPILTIIVGNVLFGILLVVVCALVYGFVSILKPKA